MAKNLLSTSLSDGEDVDEYTPDELAELGTRFWSHSPDETLFWGTSDVVDTVPSGLYRCIETDRTGPALKKISLAVDEIIELRDCVTEEVIEEIERFWTLKKDFAERGFLHKRGILMYGDPGSGKTATITRLIQNIIDRGGLAVYGDHPWLLTSCLQMLRRIEPTRPVIVILEDFETLTDRDRRENEWLAVLDGEAQIDHVVFLATTNYIENLDKRFTDRPSRFDMVVRVPMPSAFDRALFLANKEPDLTRDEIAEWVNETEGFSIAHMKELIISVRCLGQTMKDTVSRLRAMMDRKFSNDEPRDEIGFIRTATRRDTITDAEWDEIEAVRQKAA